MGDRKVTESFPYADSEGEGAEDGEVSLPHAAYGVGRRRAPRLSREDVLTVADALLLKGERVTIDRVRSRLGRGSPNTIQEHLEGWWAQLGSRLKDLPGKEFPEIPSQVGRDLKRLWDTALLSARGELDARSAAREAEMAERESTLLAREKAIEDAQAALTTRADGQAVALDLAREQLVAANQRADHLEASLEARETNMRHLEERLEVAERESRTLRAQAQAAMSVHEAERRRLETRHEASESRWLLEVDRARQALKAVTFEHERSVTKIKRRAELLENARMAMSRELIKVRGELKSALKAQRLPKKALAAVQKRSGLSASAKSPQRLKPKNG